ncbi:MAG: ribosomal protein L7/L12 [Lachnospiraceae bacterium]|nr:ribosomal protein L7/L12 [Lachnospiraceae bacterium]
MGELLLMWTGPNKDKVIQIIRDMTGLNLESAKSIADKVENGGAYTIKNPSDTDTCVWVKELNDAGAIAYLPKAVDSENPYVPPVSSNDVHLLDRQGTMDVLGECRKIATDFENNNAELNSTNHALNAEAKKSEELRNAISPGAKTARMAVSIMAGLLGLAGGPLFIVTTILAYAIMTATVIKSDKKKHQEENNAKADDYYREHVEPLREQMERLCDEREDCLHNGRYDWALSIVGKDFFYSSCIDDLYKLVESHRADSLKEALNQYDDALYKARMEEMQASIQNASEISAAEAVKQTAYDKEIAKSSRQAANAAKATAAHTRAIDKNTRRFRQ